MDRRQYELTSPAVALGELIARLVGRTFNGRPRLSRMQELPELTGDLNDHWLLTWLPEFAGVGLRVGSVERIGIDAGVMTDVCRVRLHGSVASQLPRSLVVKLTARDEPMRTLVQAFGSYAAEPHFYRVIKPRSRLASPACCANVYCARLLNFIKHRRLNTLVNYLG